MTRPHLGAHPLTETTCDSTACWCNRRPSQEPPAVSISEEQAANDARLAAGLRHVDAGPEFDPPPAEPAAPCQQHSETSREAAEQIEPARESLRGKVLAFLRKRGARGATDDEMQIALRMNPSTQRPRRIELLSAGLIRGATDGRTKTKTAIRRATRSGRPARVWVAAND